MLQSLVSEVSDFMALPSYLGELLVGHRLSRKGGSPQAGKERGKHLLDKSLFWPQTPESLLLWSFVSLPRALGHLQQLFTSDAAKESSEE